MYHIFFIHSFLDGHLGLFNILAIVNNAAMTIWVHAPFQFSVCFFFSFRADENPEMELLGYIGILFLVFQ